MTGFMRGMAGGFARGGLALDGLGQTPPEWRERARRAVAAYGALLARAARVADDGARGGILLWLGREDSPGSPAERYRRAADDLAGDYASYASDIARRRVAEVEDVVREFGERVSEAEATYGTLAAPAGAAGMPGRTLAGGLFAGGVALLGLLVLPLLVD